MDGEEYREAVRRDITRNVALHIKASPSYKVGRYVDEKVLENTILSQYGRFKTAMTRVGTVDTTENARSTYGRSVDGDALRVSEIPQELSIEKAYFDRYGHGFNSSAPDPMHQTYVCPKCGLKQSMDLGVMDAECPRCKHLTPIGQLTKDRAYKTW